MAYLDDRRKVNIWILAMAIPSMAVFALGFVSTMAVDSNSVLLDVQTVLDTLSSLAWISPLFLLIQFSMIARGTAGASWQNILCVMLTLAGAVVTWAARFA